MQGIGLHERCMHAYDIITNMHVSINPRATEQGAGRPHSKLHCGDCVSPQLPLWLHSLSTYTSAAVRQWYTLFPLGLQLYGCSLASYRVYTGSTLPRMSSGSFVRVILTLIRTNVGFVGCWEVGGRRHQTNGILEQALERLLAVMRVETPLSLKQREEREKRRKRKRGWGLGKRYLLKVVILCVRGHLSVPVVHVVAFEKVYADVPELARPRQPRHRHHQAIPGKSSR